MARGLAVPIRVGPTGGTVIDAGDVQADKVIRLALGNGDNDHAFQQDVTLGVREVFAVGDPGFRARVISQVFRVFDAFERARRFSLVRNTIRWVKGGRGEGKAGEQILKFRYVNLESDQEHDFARTFRGEGGL